MTDEFYELDKIPATVHDAEEAGWNFAIQIGAIIKAYELAINLLSDAQFQYEQKRSELIEKGVTGKNADEREAKLFPLLVEERRKLDKAKADLDVLRLRHKGRGEQLDWARSALSFMRSEMNGQ